MDRDVSINVGRVSRQFSGVKKLETRNAGQDYSGGFTIWVPEDDVQLTTKTITANGTYKAEDDGDYGWSQVTVNVDPSDPGSTVVGTDPDDGEEYAVVVGDDGELEKTRLPVSISITHLPNKLTYNDGETINPTGIVVHAYYADGSDYGTVLNSELSYQPTAADAGQAAGWSSATSSLTTNLTQPIQFVGAGQTIFLSGSIYVFGGGEYDMELYFTPSVPTVIYCSNSAQSNDRAYLLTKSSQTVSYTVRSRMKKHGATTWEAWQTYNYNYTTTSLFTHGGKTAYCYNASLDSGLGGVQTNGPVYFTQPDSPSLWTVLYGTITGSGTQIITVKWPRIIDQKILTDTFDITVES